MNPYDDLSNDAFWKTAVSTKHPLDIEHLWTPKFNLLPRHKVVTFGSCFAQHIGRALKSRGYHWLQTEKPPVNLATPQKFNYDTFSCRTGNIYTTSLLKQWVDWSCAKREMPDESWSENDRIYDPARPRVEPNGFRSVDEMRTSRKVTVEAFRKGIESSDFFVFTLGLTESWFSSEFNYEYPMCPGTAAGVFSENEHYFKNQSYSFVRSHLLAAIRVMRAKNPRLRIILTVSPVPLTATNTGEHVLVSTIYSKSVLRAVAGELSKEFNYIDYFPSFEIISSAPFKGMFYEPNLRSVNHNGVDFVMDAFFSGLYKKFGEPKSLAKLSSSSVRSDKHADLICEEELLDAFNTKPSEG